ncbi:hypothetical protein ACJJTC_008486 [Scirpophaga incertulas]
MLFTVVHEFFRRKTGNEQKKSFTLFWTGLPDGKPILLSTAYRWSDMGNIVHGGGKADAEAHAHAEVHTQSHGGHMGFRMDKLKRAGKKCSCCTRGFETIFIILCIISIVKSIGEIVVTITAAISTKLYTTEQSGRLVAMILLAVMAAITIANLAYAIIAIFKKQAKPLHAASLLLLFTAIVQGVTVSVGVRISQHDETVLNKSLEQSFWLSREKNSRNLQLWAATQSDLKCCGVYGPEEYSTRSVPGMFPPDVPISCCKVYDPSRSALVQEREREMCKAKKEYYKIGCRVYVLETFKTTAHLVLGMTVGLIGLEIILSILSAILFKRIRKSKLQSTEQTPNPM